MTSDPSEGWESARAWIVHTYVLLQRRQLQGKVHWIPLSPPPPIFHKKGEAMDEYQWELRVELHEKWWSNVQASLDTLTAAKAEARSFSSAPVKIEGSDIIANFFELQQKGIAIQDALTFRKNNRCGRWYRCQGFQKSQRQAKICI